MTPEQVAAEVLAVDASTLSATRIKGGLTNESWCVEGVDTSVVVRISTADERTLQLNRHSETRVLSLVQAAGIGAEVLLCEPERRLLVTRKLYAQTLTVEAVQTDVTIEQVAQLLRQLHALPTASAIQQIDLAATLHGYWHSLGGVEYPDVATRQQALDIALESAQSGVRCLCHNDVHHLNLMSDGTRLWLLDWEYAGIGDPFFDLAAVCCYHGYDQSLRDRLLLAYSGRLASTGGERLQRMCWLFDYIRNLWLAVRRLDDAASVTSPMRGEVARSAGEGARANAKPSPQPSPSGRGGG